MTASGGRRGAGGDSKCGFVIQTPVRFCAARGSDSGCPRQRRSCRAAPSHLAGPGVMPAGTAATATATARVAIRRFIPNLRVELTPPYSSDEALNLNCWLDDVMALSGPVLASRATRTSATDGYSSFRTVDYGVDAESSRLSTYARASCSVAWSPSCMHQPEPLERRAATSQR